MKKLILFFSLFTLAAISYGQGNWTLSGAKNRWANGMGFGNKDTSTYTNASDTNLLVLQYPGVLVYRHLLSDHWQILSYNSTVANYKLISDSLFNSGYTRRDRTKQGLDSLGALKLNISDTAAMLSNRLKISDTATMLVNRLKISDTATQMSGYARTGNLKTGAFFDTSTLQPRFNLGVKYGDTSAMLSHYALKGDTTGFGATFIKNQYGQTVAINSLAKLGVDTAKANHFIGDLTGNASTATTLQTARNINGVSFNGSSDITVTAAAGTLTGSTLNSGVTGSSLTSVGTLVSGSIPYSLLTGTPTVYSSFYLGTTSIAFNRSSGSQNLTGISIDGNAATATLAANSTLWNGNATDGTISLTPTTFNVGSSTATDAKALTIQSANGNLFIQFKNASSTNIGGIFSDDGSRLSINNDLKLFGGLLATDSVIGSSFAIPGGTSSQLLAADGSVVTAGTNVTISGGTISASGGLNGNTGIISAQTTDQTITTYTPGSNGVYLVGGTFDVTAISGSNMEMYVEWTDQNSVSRSFALRSGVSAIQNNVFAPFSVTAKSGTAINIKVHFLSGSSATYDASAYIKSMN